MKPKLMNYCGNSIAILIVAFGIQLLTGCGGSSTQPLSPGPGPGDHSSYQPTDQGSERFYTPDPDIPTGGLTFKVNWPRNHQGQIIPQETNRIIIYISGEGILPAMGVILNDVDQPSSNAFVPVPSGKDRLVSAIARHVDSMPAGTPAVNYEPKYAELLQGTMLASGRTEAFDLGTDEQKSVIVTLELPARLAADDSYVIAGGTQFDPATFPTVVVYGSVVDQDGQPILDLTMANFRVFEQTEGTSEPMEAIVTDVRYVEESGGLRAGSVVLCLDKSGSMSGTPFEDVKTAANQFVDMMYVDDRGEVINFSSDVYVDQPFTSDKALLRAAIDRWYGYVTSLYDGVYQSIIDASAQPGRKAVIVMTDGWENDSYHHLDDIRSLAVTNFVPCYTIGLGDVDTTRLTNLADATGGVAYFTPTSEDLTQIYRDIAIDLSTQIRITYVSPDPKSYDPPKVRHVYVHLTNYPPLTDFGDIIGFEATYSR